ncbi:MAG TPA: hypothetical protein VM029_21720, partial [Opitutaceae bacterium]|nr:hypothetical protein [Opitutaceae bacterium]
RTPEETVALVAGHGSVAIPTMVRDRGADPFPAPVATVRSAGGRRWLNSIRVLLGLAVVTAILAYLTFSPKTPAGVTIITDSARLAEMQRDLEGTYGRPGATLLRIQADKISASQPGAGGTATVVIPEQHYRLGQRGGQIVLLLANGAVLEVRPDRSLQFLFSIYPLQAAP